MPTTNSAKTAVIPVRFTAAQRRQIDDLTSAGFGNQADVIRTAVQEMYLREISMTPKYFVPMNSEPAITSGRNGQIGKIVGEDTDAWGMAYYLVQFGTSEPEIWYPGDGNIAYDKKQANELVRFARRMDKEAAKQ